MQLVKLITEVTDGRRPQKPGDDSPPRLSYGLTDSIWKMMVMCWASEAKLRPSVDDLLKLPCLLGVPGDHSAR
jgi:hypothetical protein